MADNIILIGFMGVGKGRTARALAEKTGMFTVDTDDVIETVVNMKIRKIFKIHGEQYFRDLEQRAADWLRLNVSNTIVSTGGGFFKVRKLGGKDRIVYLHSSLDMILGAIRSHPKAAKKIKKRPLLRKMKKARHLYDERLLLYRKAADLEVNVEGLSPDDVAGKILDKLGLE